MLYTPGPLATFSSNSMLGVVSSPINVSTLEKATDEIMSSYEDYADHRHDIIPGDKKEEHCVVFEVGQWYQDRLIRGCAFDRFPVPFNSVGLKSGRSKTRTPYHPRTLRTLPTTG